MLRLGVLLWVTGLLACDFRVVIGNDLDAGGRAGGSAAGGSATGGQGGSGGAAGGLAGGGDSTGGGSASDAGPDGGSDGGCIAPTCEQLGKNCGPVSVQCGDTVSCGMCPSPLTCGGGGVANNCGMVPVRATGCSDGGWCWVNPSPTGNHLRSVWGSGANDIWAVGGSGSVFHFDGSAWSQLEIGATGDLWSVYGSGANDVWAVGDGAHHWNGSGWSSFPAPPRVNDVWVHGPSNAWAVTQYGQTLEWDGVAWRHDGGGPGGNSIWGSSPTDVWAVGSTGIAHWDGARWTTTPHGTTPLRKVRGRTGTDVWAGGDQGTLLHWTGSAWQPAALPPTNASLGALWPAGPGSVFVGPSLWDGSSLSTFPNAGSVLGVWGASAGDVWAVGVAGDFSHFDGGSWQLTPPTIPNDQYSTVRFWASAPDDVWLAYRHQTLPGGSILRWNGTSLAPMPGPPGHQILGQISGPARDQVWVGGEVLSHWDGGTWASVALPATQYAYDVSAHAADDLWVADLDRVSRWDGLAWSTASPLIGSGFIFGLWSAPGGTAWVVGEAGGVARRNGAGWAVFGGLTGRLYSVWGSSPNDVWIVGDSGKILHWNGTALTPVASGTMRNLTSVSGTSATDVWAVGDQGTVLHWEGTSWSPSASGCTHNLYEVLAIDPANTWLSGYYGSVLRRR